MQWDEDLKEHDLKDWSLAELIAGRDLARMFQMWHQAAEIQRELVRRGFTA